MSALSHRSVTTNGVRLHIAEQGQGPLVVLLHGFPESWYSWRHQLGPLAAAGYHVVAPDLRGFGDSDKPQAVSAYDQVELAADVAGLIDALGEQRAVVVGHDWGAPAAWHSALLYPDKVRGVVGLSVPYGGRTSSPPLPRLRELFKEVFFYMLYFQGEGVAEAELEADVRTSLRKFYLAISGDAPQGEAFAIHPKTAKLFDTLYDDGRIPAFLDERDLDYYTQQFQRSGFRGPLNLYRNFDRTWERTAALQGAKFTQPVLFIGGESDPVVLLGARQLERLPQLAPLYRGACILPGCGHWTQQERPAETTQALLDFLRELPA
ncbi:MAG TPA: alpha/beta hydrolase [Polyangiales bacterium]